MRIVRKTARGGVVRTGVVTAAAGVAVFGFGGVAQAADGGADTGLVDGDRVGSSTLSEPRDATTDSGDSNSGDSASQDTTSTESATTDSATTDDAATDSASQDGGADDRDSRDTTSEDSAPRVVDGECDSTLKGEDGEPLAVDVGAAVGAEGLAGIGTGSEAEDTLVSLPLKETLATLGVNETGLVVDSLGQVCDTTRRTVNTLGATTHGLTEGLTPEEPAPEEPGDPEQPGEPQPEPQPEPEPGPERPGTDPGEDESGADVPDAPAPAPVDQDVLAQPLSPVELPPSADITVPKAPVGPGMDVPNQGSRPGAQENTTRKSGTARALPQASETDRLPLAVSVGALLLVVAGLSRAWVARKNA
ncbi:hypothetical protein LY13_003913 [Prauserella aidingensis]|uniref:hypothetical protein n=1 Tax=Prauserella aidingensis TaxID=387890 RepID=UPI0020A2A823|nr:hypothetical protein [Prauserella aidingensis]MCP2255139.1 hypothetical protein [Prauserella aidingensis]